MENKNSNFENIFIIPELFENLNKYTDGKSNNTLLFSSKKLYNKYISDKFTIRQNINKFINELRLNKRMQIYSKFNNFTDTELMIYYLDWVSIHSYFIHFNTSDLTDILVFLIDRNKKYITSLYLFEQIVKRITYKENDITCFYRNPISYNQYSIIISECDLKQLVVFFQHTMVSTNIIGSVIKQMVSKPKIDTTKIQHCLQYVLLKTTFGHRRSQKDSYFINDIIFELIRANQIQLMKFLFQKRSFVKNFFDYQFMVLRALELDKIEILCLIQELEQSLFLPRKEILFITTNRVYDLCERGSFHVLKWIVKYQLDRLINLGSYISSIHSGIIACEKTEHLESLFQLTKYFNNNSIEKLNDALCFLYKKLKISDEIYLKIN
jgi:hypothetical protein